MSKRAKEWAIKKRSELVYKLGGKCVTCGEEDYEKLTFDHVHGKDWEATGLSTDQRMLRYSKEEKQGLLQILCHSCNSKKGDPRRRPERERCHMLISIGNACCTPGCAQNYVKDLHFVHRAGPGWEPVDLDFEARLRLYQSEVSAGRMSILCNDCIETAGLEPTDLPVATGAYALTTNPF